jgi:Domain of unknown function (DUF3516)
MFQCVRALARRDWSAAAAMFGLPGAPAMASAGEEEWSAARFEQALQPFFEEHGSLRTDPTSRAPQNTRVTKSETGTWEIVQVLCDPEGHDDWALSASVDLEASAKAGRPVMVMRGISR